MSIIILTQYPLPNTSQLLICLEFANFLYKAANNLARIYLHKTVIVRGVKMYILFIVINKVTSLSYYL